MTVSGKISTIFTATLILSQTIVVSAFANDTSVHTTRSIERTETDLDMKENKANKKIEKLLKTDQAQGTEKPEKTEKSDKTEKREKKKRRK